MKKLMRFALCPILIAVFSVSLATCFVGCEKESEFSNAMPDLAASEWENTLESDFTSIKSLDGTVWAPSPHGLRNYEYWCEDMIDFSDEGVVIKSRQSDDYVCSAGKCPTKGVFTSGIETRTLDEFYKDENDNFVGDNGMLFAQAFGYFEATVRVPRGEGMWSAFWLQSVDVGKVGNGGRDGAEIDVYESSFGVKNPTQKGSCIHIDAYSAPFYRSKGGVYDVGYDLYDGQFHTYSLLWTPENYTVFVDGIETFVSDFGGVSTVPEFLRLTVEIRDSEYGPYGQKLGVFENHDDDTNDFVIKSVRVFQNETYKPYIKSPSNYKDRRTEYMNLIIAGSVAGGVIVVAAVVSAVLIVLKRKKKRAQG